MVTRRHSRPGSSPGREESTDGLHRREGTAARARSAELSIDRSVAGDVLADVAHRVRNYLTIVQSYLEILHSDSGPVLDDDQLSFLGAAHDNILQLGRLIEDLVLIGAIETEIADFEQETIDVGSLMRDLCRNLHEPASIGGIALSCEIGDDIGSVRGDRELLIDAIGRITDNALRFTERRGSVKLHAHRNASTIVIAVSDSGPGIDPDDLEGCFDLMSQLQREPGHPRRGHGLGLPVARTVIRAHGGRIRARSSVGGGSTFEILLPVEVK